MNNEDIFKTYWGIREQVNGIHYYWYILEQIHKDKNRNIINKTSHEYFGYSVRVFMHYIALNLAKLLDKPKIYGNDNLSLRKLIDDLKAGGYEIEELDKKYDTLREYSKIIKEFRDKIVAHNDYKYYLNNKNVSVKIKEAEEVLLRFRDFIKTSEIHILKIRPTMHPYSDESARIQAENHIWGLVHHLENALKLETLEKDGRISKAKLNGEYTHLRNR